MIAPREDSNFAAYTADWAALIGAESADEAPLDLLSHEQEIALSKRIQAGDRQARNRLVEKNLRLVVSIAKHWIGQGLDLDDLVQEGNVGLMKAADRYKWQSGNRFSTYATWWIKQAISRAVAEKGRAVRLPVYAGGHLSKARKTAARLAVELGRQPSVAEIAEAIGISEDKLAEITLAGREVASLDAPSEATYGRTDVDPDAVLGAVIADDAGEFGEAAMYEAAERNDAAEELHRIMDTALTPREKLILLARHEPGGTLEAIGAELHITRERVRQIEELAKTKLRSAYRMAGYRSIPRVRYQPRTDRPNKTVAQFLAGDLELESEAV